MINLTDGCLGKEFGYETCPGPDENLTSQLGQSACSTCLVGGYKQLAKENADLHTQAEIDPVTGIYSRGMFDRSLSERVVDGKPFPFLFIDLKSFSKVNSRRRHTGGDDMLRATGEFLSEFFSKSLRQEDVVARIGGDEFGIILSSSRDGQECDVEAVETIKTRLSEAFLRDPAISNYNGEFGSSEPLGMYIGSAFWEPGMSSKDLLSVADPDKKSLAS